jgi:NAD(P)-dependent dehydrogenase (short-subunit alcohol dehydrogenase family)
MDTPMMARSPEKVRQNLLQSVVAPKRFGTADEFGKLVLSIASNEYLNGESIRLDGGIRMANL